MTAHSQALVRRVLVAGTNAASCGLVSFFVVVIVHQIVRLFALVTVGPPVLETPLVAIISYDFSVVRFAAIVALLVSAFVSFAALRPASRFSASLHAAVYPVPALALLGVVSLAYRFLGLLVVIGCLVLYVRVLRKKTRVRTFVWACMFLVALLGSPVDVTLQNVPGRPHFAMATFGLPSLEGAAMAERGETVEVGGCSVEYYPPMWALVW
jgi:hypothetical protein